MNAFDAFLVQHGLNHQATTPVVSATAGRKDLCALFQSMGYQHGAEIGVWQGRFSEQLCVANPGVKLLCVDPWQAYTAYEDPKNQADRLEAAYVEACRRLAPYGCDIRRMTSAAAAKTVPDGSLDYVYLDGNHAKSFVYADLAAWVPKVRSGGIVSGHDFEVVKQRAHLEVREAVDGFARQHQIAPIYVLTNDKTPSFFWRVP